MEMMTVLYFYSEDCQDCNNQGTVLSYYKALLESSFLVFPIDQAIVNEEPLVQILVSLYEVEDLPTMVINDEIFRGYIGKEELSELICADMPDLELCV